jgi:hypothetical protein
MFRYAYIVPGGFPTVEKIDAFCHVMPTVYCERVFAQGQRAPPA